MAQRSDRLEAAKLRGKLFFTCLAAFARVGRAALRVFTERQYTRERGEAASLLTPALIASISFFIALLPSMPARELRLGRSPRMPVLIWTDASWENGFGALGIVIYLPYGKDGKGAFLFSFLIVPGWLIALLVPKKQHIGQLEILAAVYVYLSVPQLVAGELIIHMVDNTSAIFSLVRGYSSKEDSAALVNIFHLVCAVIRPEVLWDYIESKANVADLPSRLEFEYLLALGATFFPIVLPPPGMWSSPLEAWLAVSEMLAPHAPRRRLRAGRRSSKRPAPA